MARFVIMELDTDDLKIIEKYANAIKDVRDGGLICMPANITRYVNIEDGKAEVMK